MFTSANEVPQEQSPRC